MRDLRFTLIRIIAVILVIGLLLFSPLLGLTAKNGGDSTMNVPPQPRYVTTFERPRPEIRVERVLKLDDLTGFDPDIASLLEASGGTKSSEITTMKDAGVSRYEEVASISHEAKGGSAR